MVSTNSMKIEHVAIWVNDLERVKNFYSKYFGARPNEKYINPTKGFSSCFLSFGSGARLEIMQMSSVEARAGNPRKHHIGLTHLSISVGSVKQVDALTMKLAAAGYEVLDGPRRTGDGGYESVVLDPENNRVEISI